MGEILLCDESTVFSKNLRKKSFIVLRKKSSFIIVRAENGETDNCCNLIVFSEIITITNNIVKNLCKTCFYLIFASSKIKK